MTLSSSDGPKSILISHLTVRPYDKIVGDLILRQGFDKLLSFSNTQYSVFPHDQTLLHTICI